MALFTIRAHKRFAVCRKVWLRQERIGPERIHQERQRGLDGLLIELSRDGCRISHAASQADFAIEESVTLAIAGAAPIAARVRWLHDGAIGLRFAQPLHNAALESLIGLCRGEGDPLPAYGT
jgi:hypothetical protein